MSEDGGDRQLGILASITAGIESTQTEIKGVQIQNNVETHDARVQLAIPLDGVNGLDKTRVKTDHTDIVNNSLQFELTLEIDDVDRRNPNASRSVSEGQDSTDSRPDESNERTDQSEKNSASASQTDDDDQDPDREATQATSVAGTEFDNAPAEPQGEEVTDFGDREDRPEYQDPEQLAAVYDETATFEEMRDELDVDVTAQTVRKYMIKHGIHEPEPRPDRLLETIRASELELMNSEDDDRSEQTENTTDSDTG